MVYNCLLVHQPRLIMVDMDTLYQGLYHNILNDYNVMSNAVRRIDTVEHLEAYYPEFYDGILKRGSYSMKGIKQVDMIEHSDLVMALKLVCCIGDLPSFTLDPTTPSSISVLVLPLCVATPILPLYATGKNLPLHSPLQFLPMASTLALPLCVSTQVFLLCSLDPSLPLHPSNAVLLVPTVGSLLPHIAMLESRLNFWPPKRVSLNAVWPTPAFHICSDFRL